MITSFIHKELERFYKTGKLSGIQAKHADNPSNMDLPGLHLHKLKGNRESIWSASVSGNGRVTFRFIDQEVEIFDYEDYH